MQHGPVSNQFLPEMFSLVQPIINPISAAAAAAAAAATSAGLADRSVSVVNIPGMVS